MARKDLLKGLIDGNAPSSASTSADKPRYTKGAIGVVSRSIADLKARAVIELTADQIDPGGLTDRLEIDPAADLSLQLSIQEHGQQVPVLVRPHPTIEDRFQIVYGRRRVAALRALNLPIKALVRDLDDRSMVLAQGQENTARRDLSFIEKVNFARQMNDAGYDRKSIGDALSIDKTLISRMLTVADKIPLPVIEAIGAAPSVGRDRWLALAEACTKFGGSILDLLSDLSEPTSDQRFEALHARLTHKGRAVKTPTKAVPYIVLSDGLGRRFARVRTTDSHTTVTFDRKRADGFDEWLLTALPDLRAKWLTDINEGGSPTGSNDETGGT